MLGRVGVDHHPMNGQIAEALRLVCLHLAKRPPARRRARDVLVDRPFDVRHERAAAWTGARLSFGGAHVWSRCRPGSALDDLRETHRNQLLHERLG
jgi:hypothetical protein